MRYPVESRTIPGGAAHVWSSRRQVRLAPLRLPGAPPQASGSGRDGCGTNERSFLEYYPLLSLWKNIIDFQPCRVYSLAVRRGYPGIGYLAFAARLRVLASPPDHYTLRWSARHESGGVPESAEVPERIIYVPNRHASACAQVS